MPSQESPADENPYAAPQAELATRKPRVDYVLKFNGRLAFWSAIILGALLLSVDMPEVKTHRTESRTVGDYIFAFSMIAAISISIGTYLGFMIGIPVPRQTKEPEQIFVDESKL